MFSFFESLIKPFPSEPPQQPPNTLKAFILHYANGTRRFLAALGLFTMLIAILEVSLFNFLGNLVDNLNNSSPTTYWQTHGRDLLFYGLPVLLGLPLCVFIHSLILHQTLLGNFAMRVRWLAHRHLLGQSVAFYQNEFAGRMATKVMQTALSVREAIIKLLDVILYVAVFFAGVLTLLATLDLRLAIPLTVWIIIYISILKYFLPRLARVSSRQADARSDMTGRIVDTYTNINTVKLFSHSQREEHYAREGMENFLQTVHPQMRLVTKLSTSVWSLNAVLIFCTTSLSIWLWANNAITTGSIAIAVGLVLRMYGMSQWIMWEVSGLFENLGTARDGMNTLAVERSVLDSEQAAPIAITNGKIAYNNVSFHYGKENGVIENFNLTIAPGEKIGLVGRSGAGKSTLVNLLLRFYDIESGSITIDDQNIATHQQESLRQHIAMVTQDTSLLHRSVRDNLLYGNPNASEEQMLLAAQRAKAHEFILELEDGQGRKGYDAHVGERGVKLSGGQRQRIAIARAFLKDAPILVLDEATSALDSEVESAIQENLNQLMQGKTVIAIAHRLSTIAALDKLVVIDQGNIIEHGTHKELLAANGTYAKLWQHQSGGFLGE